MAISRVKTWIAEVLTYADLNAEFNNILNNGISLISPLTANLAAGGFKITGLAAGTAAGDALRFEQFFATNTRILFQQTTPPTGWTKESSATYDDAALRMVTGTVSTGGANAFSAHFGTSKSTDGFTLSTAEIPAHTHNFKGTDGAAGGLTLAQVTASVANNTGDGVTNTTGGGGSHSHTLSNFNIKYADVVIGIKD